MEMSEMYRQGDLLFVKVDKIPKGSRKADTDVILEGEATGHSHKLEDGEILLDWHGFHDNGETGMYIDIPLRGLITHEEHDTLTLPKGKYKVVRQREYEKPRPDAGGAWRYVAD